MNGELQNIILRAKGLWRLRVSLSGHRNSGSGKSELFLSLVYGTDALTGNIQRHLRRHEMNRLPRTSWASWHVVAVNPAKTSGIRPSGCAELSTAIKQRYEQTNR